MQRFVPNIAYWGGKLVTDSLKDIKGYRNTSKYVERDFDQIGYKPKTSQSMPYRPKSGKKRAYGGKPRTSMKKRKRTYVPRSYKPKKIVRKKISKTTLATRGLIDVSKRATAPKGHVAMIRRKNYGSVTSNAVNSPMAWIGVSDIGDQHFFCDSIAQAILMKYLKKLGDHRTRTDYDPSVIDPNHSQDMFHSFQVTYQFDAYNETVEASGRSDALGTAWVNASIDTMSNNLGNELYVYARDGAYPVSIKFYADDFVSAGSTVKGAPKIFDNRLGEHRLDMKITTILKLHNISPSDTTDPGENPGNTVLDINSNPVQGKIFTYRNQAPVFHDAYQINVDSDPTTKNGIEDLNTYHKSRDILPGEAFYHLKRPPLNAKAIWSNVSGQGTIMMSPGQYRTYNCKFHRSETVKNLLKGVIRASNISGKNPPIGSSVMMCFQPTMRTSAGELVKIGWDYTSVYNVALQFKKHLGLPCRDL